MRLHTFALAAALLCAPLAAHAQGATYRTDSAVAAAAVVPSMDFDPKTKLPAGLSTIRLANAASISNGGCSAPVTGMPNGSYIIAVTAIWNSATITLQALGPDNSTYLPVTGASWTANGTVGVVIAGNATVKLCASGGAPTNVNSVAG